MPPSEATPLVTALMPVRAHRPEYLAAALDSLRSQTDPGWRALVVVEPGDEATVSAAAGPARDDARIEVVVNEGVRLAGALNTGMRRATTAFVAILLGDDLWSPEAVAVLRAEISSRPGVDFFHSARRVIDDRGQPLSGVYPARAEVALADFAVESPVKHLLCWRRSLGLAVGGMDERSRSVGPDDFDFPWTMAEHGAVFGAVDECLYVYRDHRSHWRITTDLPRTAHLRELARLFRKHGVPWPTAARRLLGARRGYLRQCRYRSPLDRRVQRWLGREGRGRRETYARAPVGQVQSTSVTSESASSETYTMAGGTPSA